LGYRPALDGVRAIAILIVLSWHTWGWPPAGSLGVDLFFVLSGFLITTLLLEERETSGRISLTRFFRRRALRLLPALYFMLLVVVAVLLVVGGDDRRTFLTALGAATYWSNFLSLGLHSSGHVVAPALQHLWSLAQEEQFYLLWPPVLVVVMKYRPRLLAPIITSLIAVVVIERLVYTAGSSPVWAGRVYVGPDMHADPILVGCLFGVFFSRGEIITSRLSRQLLGFASLGTIAGLTLIFHGGTNLALYGTPLLTLFAFATGTLILCLASGESTIASVFGCLPARFLGRISYGMYLWHLPILMALASLGAWRAPLGLAGTVAAATGSLYLIERPFLRMKHRRLTAAPPTQVAPATA
jgi:peptidoglycan/LPS O-acetylase OafA/YrhL